MIVNENPVAARPAPASNRGIWGWMRQKLFSSPANTVLTVVTGWLLYIGLTPVISWSFIEADWFGSDRSACDGGACWVFITARIEQFIYGFYPEDLRWRVDLVFLQTGLLLLWLMPQSMPGKKWGVIYALSIFPISSFFLLSGGLGLEMVDTHKWGGLMLTLVLALVGIVAALPFGVLLALGRRSEMPVIRFFCTTFIEVWRGVPLITVLFMASVMLPLFVPEEVVFDKLVRALIGIVMFQSAYMAEVVRGGLQAIPRGQYEAAAAMGLGYWKMMRLVILPQALKMVIPGIVNTFIALFKDTSLVLIIGLFDLLAIVQAGLADPKWLGFAIEGYVFAGFVFWFFCFSMSRYSQSLEKRLNTGHKA
ncbi:amino acid ABC transporter permease [Spongorhabdus nitratireducens]